MFAAGRLVQTVEQWLCIFVVVPLKHGLCWQANVKQCQQVLWGRSVVSSLAGSTGVTVYAVRVSMQYAVGVGSGYAKVRLDY